MMLSQEHLLYWQRQKSSCSRKPSTEPVKRPMQDINSPSEKQTQVQAEQCHGWRYGGSDDSIDATKRILQVRKKVSVRKRRDITDKTAEIEESKENLAEAEKVRDKQYQDK